MKAKSALWESITKESKFMISAKTTYVKAYLAPKILCVPCECINLICSTVPQVHNKYSGERQLSHPDFLPTTIDNEDFEEEDN